MKTGIYDNLDFKEYRSKLDFVSITELNTYLDLPLLYKHKILEGNRTPASKSQDEGTALHAFILERDIFNKTYTPMPECDLRTKEGKAIKAECDAEALSSGKIYLKQEAYNRVISAGLALTYHPEVSKLLPGLKSEVSFFSQHQLSGMPIKARIDAINEEQGVLIDVKSTLDVKHFHESVFKYHYHRQVAFYLDLYESLTGRRMKWQWWCVELQAPYINAVYEPIQDLEIIGRQEYEKGLFSLKKAREYDYYPGMPQNLLKIFVPNWYLKKTEQKNIGEMKNGI